MCRVKFASGKTQGSPWIKTLVSLGHEVGDNFLTFNYFNVVLSL
jgi:hypothetical protein